MRKNRRKRKERKAQREKILRMVKALQERTAKKAAPKMGKRKHPGQKRKKQDSQKKLPVTRLMIQAVRNKEAGKIEDIDWYAC